MLRFLFVFLFVVVALIVLTVRVKDPDGVVYVGAAAEDKQIIVTEHTNGKTLKISVDGILVFHGIIKKSSSSHMVTRVPVPTSSGHESRLRIHGDFTEADTVVNWSEYNSVIIHIGKRRLFVSFTNDPVFL